MEIPKALIKKIESHLEEDSTQIIIGVYQGLVRAQIGGQIWTACEPKSYRDMKDKSDLAFSDCSCHPKQNPNEK